MLSRTIRFRLLLPQKMDMQIAHMVCKSQDASPVWPVQIVLVVEVSKGTWTWFIFLWSRTDCTVQAKNTGKSITQRANRLELSVAKAGRYQVYVNLKQTSSRQRCQKVRNNFKFKCELTSAACQRCRWRIALKSQLNSTLVPLNPQSIRRIFYFM